MLANSLIAIGGERLERGRVYTVAEVQARLLGQPGAWIGRTVRVRGRAEGCPGILPPAAQLKCQGWDRFYLTDAAAPATEPLLLVQGNPGPLLAALRRLPLVGRLVPQQLRWGMLATYRMRLRAARTRMCGTPPCNEAVLLDAAPDSLLEQQAMKRSSLLLLGLLLPGLAAVGINVWPRPGPVYTVARVRAALAQHPRVWTGRTLLLRGVALTANCRMDLPATTLVCPRPRAALGDADPRATGAALPLAWAGPDPLLAAVRREPLLGRLMPAPQILHWGAVATYRVRLRAIANSICGTGVCYEAVLLDAAAPSLGQG